MSNPWDDMTPRERDALVAEKVMGWKWDESRCRVCGWPLATDPMASAAGCIPGNCSLRPVPARRADESPPYSTDIAAAWQIVDKLGMCVRPDMALFGRDGDDDYHYGWRAIAGKLILSGGYTEHGEGVFVAVAATAPEAICRAALRTLGVVV